MSTQQRSALDRAAPLVGRPVVWQPSPDGGNTILAGGFELHSKLIDRLSQQMPTVEHVIILGASHEVNSFGTSDLRNNAIARVLAATGKTITISSYAQSGQGTGHLLNSQWPTAKAAELATAPAGPRTLVIVGIGGNDVTPIIPIDGASDEAVLTTGRDRIISVINEIDAIGWDWHLMDLTWRDYNPPACRSNRNLGSYPWVERVNRAINRDYYAGYRRRVHADGSAWGNTYAFTRNNRQYLHTDGNHMTDPVGRAAYRNFIVDNVIVPSILKNAPPVLLPRDETYPLSANISASVVDGTEYVRVTSTHQGTLHVGPAGSSQSALMATDPAVTVTGTGIDKQVSVVVGGAGSAIFVADTGSVSSVQSLTPAHDAVLFVMRQATPSGLQNVNDVLSWSAGAKVLAAVNALGQTTGISLHYINVGRGASDTLGVAAMSAPPKFPEGAAAGYHYAAYQEGLFDPFLEFELRGLVPGSTYRITCAGVRTGTTDDGKRGTALISGATEATYNAAQSSSSGNLPHAYIDVVASDAGVINAKIQTTVSLTDGSRFAYLSAMCVQQLI